MRPTYSLILTGLLSAIVSACGDTKENPVGSSNDILGEVTVTVADKQYVLPVQVCDPPRVRESFQGEMTETFSIWAFDGFENEERTYPTFYMGGDKEEKLADFSLTLGDVDKGGKEFDGKISYEEFAVKGFNYKGVIHPFPRESEDDGLPVEIKLNCEEKKK